MNALRFKLFLYRFFTTPFGQIMLRFLFFGITIKNLEAGKQQKHPFFVVITTDTESGYVDKDERRVWQKENPRAFEGYYHGIRNLMRVFEKHSIKTTFFLSTNCFSSKKKESNLIKKELKNLIKKGHELGLHFHPDSDMALQKKLRKQFNATSAFFYDYNEKLKIIMAGKKLIEEHLGKNVTRKLVSVRWGNWALDSGGAKALNASGFKIDSSATPGIKGHTNDTAKYDWSSVKRHHPWKLSITDYQATNHNNSNMLEIPIATFDFFNIKMRADPVNSVLLNHTCKKYYRNADRSKKPFVFVVITHSSEATTKDGKSTRALHDLDAFLSFAKKYSDAKFVTLKDAYKSLTK